MDFLVNESSIHGQFHTTAEFFSAVERLMEIRHEIQRVGSELFCHRDMATAQVTPQHGMSQAIQGMAREKQRAWIQWLTRFGPYWMDIRQHDENEWLELADGGLVTNTAIGEAAFCRLHDLSRELVSIDPSDWLSNPIVVTWQRTAQAPQIVDVKNHWTLATVSQSLANAPPTFHSWHTLEERARQACGRLRIADNAFGRLDGHPYAPGAAERIWILLNKLNTYCGCFDQDGNRTPEGDQIYADHFVGGKAWFTDSSDSEKNEFKLKLTFPHPEQPGAYLFCPWHGKVKTPPIRMAREIP